MMAFTTTQKLGFPNRFEENPQPVMTRPSPSAQDPFSGPVRLLSAFLFLPAYLHHSEKVSLTLPQPIMALATASAAISYFEIYLLSC